MIITKSPFRISFIGGGSDLPSFFRNEEGAVLSTSINQYIYISSHRFFAENQIRLKYSQTETVNSIQDIQHPIFREALRQFNMNAAVEISSNADIPSGSGLGSSSSFTANLLLNCYIRSNQYISKEKLADNACNIELNKLNEPIGKQDHYAAVYGGLNIIIFKPSGTVEIQPLCIKNKTKQLLDQRLLMFYTGQQRSASAILKYQNQAMLKEQKREVVKKMVSLVWDAKEALYQDDLDRFGNVLAQNWELKKEISDKISNQVINNYVDRGLAVGAEAAKLLGAGESGFLLFYCKESYQEALRHELKELRELKFKFEDQGTRMIYYGDE
ncbi:GHMP kinase [Candidatus Marinamargulisbacteria bacterium SCGC AG-333-B06]|nr:GHMP kinase [Candidatus Marinamargulisbacteria bacterium SCGC AG-333-B06]